MDWTQRTSGFGADYVRCVWHNKSNLWLIGGAAGKLASSPDGAEWTLRDSKFGTSYIRCIGYSIPDSLWIIGGPSDKSAKSSDGINWELFLTYIGSMHSVVHNGLTGGSGLWVAVGAVGKIRTSPDAGTWTPRTCPFGNEQIWDVAYSIPDSLWVIVANNNKIATSSDGFSWTTRAGPFGFGDGIEGVQHNGKDLWVCVADYGKLATSSNGLSWTPQDSDVGTSFFRGVDHDQFNSWVAVTSPSFYPHETDNIVSSSNGINWTLEDAGFGTDEIFGVWHNRLPAENGLWIVVGENGKLATSPGYPLLYPKKTIWSYGKSALINSIKTDITPRWSYGKSTLRQDFIGEQFIRKIINTLGVTDTVSRSISFVRKITNTIGITDTVSRSVAFVRKITDTIGISDVLIFIRRKIDSFGASAIRGIHRIGSPEIKKIHRIESSEIEKVDRIGSPEIKGK